MRVTVYNVRDKVRGYRENILLIINLHSINYFVLVSLLLHLDFVCKYICITIDNKNTIKTYFYLFVVYI